jgi:hypothetical protein
VNSSFTSNHLKSVIPNGGVVTASQNSQSFDALFRRIAGDQRRIDGPNRNPRDPVGVQISFRQCLVDASLIRAERAPALHDQHNAFKWRTLGDEVGLAAFRPSARHGEKFLAVEICDKRQINQV